MLNLFAKDKSTVLILFLHLAIGVISAYFKFAFFFFFLVVVVTTAWSYLKNPPGNSYLLIYLLFYVLGVEVCGRMLGLAPFIPSEIGKYLPLLIVAFILLFEKAKCSNILPGALIVMLVIPSLIMSNEDRPTVIYTTFGILNLGVIVMLLYERRVTMDFYTSILRVTILSIVPILGYVTVKTPKFSEMEFSLNANFSTTGGFGSNQVSTVFGIGFLLVGIFIFMNRKLFAYKVLDIALFTFFVFRGLLSFSRGGVLVAAASLIFFVFYINRANVLETRIFKVVKLKVGQILIGSVVLVFIFVLTNELTGGVLLLRYQGETNRTLAGRGDVSLSTLTTGRSEIMGNDFEIWYDHWGWGVGSGNTYQYRGFYGMDEVAPHSEISRLFAEHGIPGIIIVFLLFFLPIKRALGKPKVIVGLIVALWFLAIGTSFHAAMRTLATPLFFGLCLVEVVGKGRQDFGAGKIMKG